MYSIAKKCGYTTQSSFTRSFRQIIGMVPMEYRARHGEVLR